MSVFNDYANYYNLIYKDKNYHAEVDYVLDLINQYKPNSQSILNLGCGTGNHDFIFGNKGYKVTGVDLSQSMIDIANAKKQNEAQLDFLQGDIRTLKLNQTFDIVMSLFHVMSYQTINDDLSNAIKTAHAHLEKDGLFVFDCWYGPGVLTDRPSIRNKTFENADYFVNRLSTPIMYPNDNCVDVVFDVSITDKKTNQQYVLNEVHKMRYLFLPEIKLLLNQNGFELILSEEWLTKNELTYNSWNATFVARKK
jgi:SAM-dependent methyltransferase